MRSLNSPDRLFMKSAYLERFPREYGIVNRFLVKKLNRAADTFRISYGMLRIFLVCMWLLIPFLCNIKTLVADEWYTPDGLKIETFYGKSNWTSIGPDPDGDYAWTNISLFAGKKIFSWLEISAGLGPGYIDYDSHGSTPTAEMRLLGRLNYGYFYFDLGGGLAYLFDRDNLPDLGNSNLYCTFSASAGIEVFRLNDAYRNLHCRAGYRVDHMSSVFHDSSDGDNGLNIGAIELTFGWDF